mgnify:CR=1 FL=1
MNHTSAVPSADRSSAHDELLLGSAECVAGFPLGVDAHAAKMPAASDCAHDVADLVLRGTDAKVCMSPREMYGLYSSSPVTGSARELQSCAQCVEMSTTDDPLL